MIQTIEEPAPRRVAGRGRSCPEMGGGGGGGGSRGAVKGARKVWRTGEEGEGTPRDARRGELHRALTDRPEPADRERGRAERRPHFHGPERGVESGPG